MQSSPEVDIVIIGGGIHGAGVAQAAAGSGYSVLLLEKNTFASGTSSRSSKLIHGGLRYLESAQFRVVRSCLAERKYLIKSMPDLVKLIAHFIPIYRHTIRRPWQIRLGLSLYQLLGQFHASTTFRTVPRSEWQTLDGIVLEDLHCVFQYWDAQTDDRLLTHAVIQSAIELGASCLEYATFERAQITADATTIHYHFEGQDYKTTARIFINAGGPWANDILQRIEPNPPMFAIDLVQGAHIVLDHPAPKGVYYVEAPSDQRAVFIMPWKNKMLVGTTESRFTGQLDHVSAQPEEIDYLRRTVSFYFPQVNTDPLDSWAGVRVLPHSDSSPFSRSRETLIYPNDRKNPRIITIYGGKLTEFRLVAQRLMALI